ncbi:hypothetical protein TNCV_3428781 [Trichonephila clavipes]|nr:hypothetical protein TNCV_3428781 [Trichonephila clavipes]
MKTLRPKNNFRAPDRENCPLCVLNTETKLEILNRVMKGECGASLAKFYNVGKLTILLKVNNNNERSKGPSNADAFSVLETAGGTSNRVLSYSTTAAQENHRP